MLPQFGEGPGRGRRHQALRLRVLGRRARLHARPRPGRRPCAAHAAGRGQSRLPRGPGPARARGDGGQHAHVQGVRRPGEAPGGTACARRQDRGEPRGAAGPESLQARQQEREREEHGRERRGLPGRQRPRQGPAEVLHAPRPGSPRRVHQPARPQPRARALAARHRGRRHLQPVARRPQGALHLPRAGPRRPGGRGRGVAGLARRFPTGAVDRRHQAVLRPRRHGRGPRRTAGEAGHGVVALRCRVGGRSRGGAWLGGRGGPPPGPAGRHLPGLPGGRLAEERAGRRPQGGRDRAAACRWSAGGVVGRGAVGGAARAVGGHRSVVVPELAGGVAALLPPRPAPPGGRPPAAHRARRRDAPGRGSRAVGALGPARLGQPHHRAAVDVRASPRNHTRGRGREAAPAPYASRQMGDELRGRQAVLRARGAPASTEETRRTDRRRGPGGAGTPARRLDQQPAQPGRNTDPGTSGAAVRHRHAMDITRRTAYLRRPAKRTNRVHGTCLSARTGPPRARA
ncbi:hypothetical protein SGPA1_22098 [Streptomyces misionensis JCM 4497]